MCSGARASKAFFVQCTGVIKKKFFFFFFEAPPVFLRFRRRCNQRSDTPLTCFVCTTCKIKKTRCSAQQRQARAHRHEHKHTNTPSHTLFKFFTKGSQRFNFFFFGKERMRLVVVIQAWRTWVCGHSTTVCCGFTGVTMHA